MSPTVELMPPPSREDARRPGKITVDLDHELPDQVRDAVMHLSGPPYRMTIRSLIEDALRSEIKRMRDDLLAGRPFPRREREQHQGPAP